MFCFRSLISVDQHIEMAQSVNSTDPCLKAKRIDQFNKSRNNSNQFNKSRNNSNQLNIPACDQSRSALIDVLILIAVICACGFLVYPYFKILGQKTVELAEEVMEVVIEEVVRAPLVFGCLGLSIFFAVTALVAVTVCTDSRCGKLGCRGLRKAAEFDIQLETGNKPSLQGKSSLKKGLFELPRDHHRELEAELRKMAPPNGKAVLLFRARCGCSVGRMEVPGPRKSPKVKKKA